MAGDGHSLQKAGLGGLMVHTKYGGLGQGLFALARCCEILGAECASTAISFGMHCVGSSVIGARPTEFQADAFLRPIAEGRHLTTLALSESGTGSHFYFPQAQLSKNGRDWLIEGVKHFVTNGSHADSYVISVIDRNSPDLATFSCVVVEDGTEGMSWGETWQGFGMRGNDSRALSLKNVRIPAANLLGSEGDEIWYVFQVVAPHFLIAMSGSYLGVASDAFELARRHVASREYQHDGRRVADAQVVQHRLGALWGRLEATRQLVFDAARRFDAGDETATIAIMAAKAEVADTATNIVNEAMTLMGGIAYRDGAKIQRHLRDVRAAHVMAPTTDLLRTWAGRRLLDQPMFGD